MFSGTRSVVTMVLVSSLLAQSAAFAEDRDPLGISKDTMNPGGGSEFVYRNDSEEMLVPVYLLGAVNKPGIYHIPVKTDLVTLLTLAGGTLREAVTGDVVIKKQQTHQVVQVNLDTLMENKDLRPPYLNNNDVVYIKTRQPAVSTDTVAIVGIIAAVLGVGLSAIALSKSH